MEAILDFITQNWTFLLILVGSILVILTLYMLFNARPSDAKTPEETTPKKDSFQPTATAESVPFVPQEPVLKNGEILPTLILPQAEAVSDPQETPAAQPVLPLEQPQTIVVPTPPADEQAQAPERLPKPKKPLGRYHVMFRAADEKWIVKRENAERIIRVLETQKEAISFATIKALTNETTIVIHKKDGKIRKQNYKKSDEA